MDYFTLHIISDFSRSYNDFYHFKIAFLRFFQVKLSPQEREIGKDLLAGIYTPVKDDEFQSIAEAIEYTLPEMIERYFSLNWACVQIKSGKM